MGRIINVFNFTNIAKIISGSLTPSERVEAGDFFPEGGIARSVLSCFDEMELVAVSSMNEDCTFCPLSWSNIDLRCPPTFVH